MKSSHRSSSLPAIHHPSHSFQLPQKSLIHPARQPFQVLLFFMAAADQKYVSPKKRQTKHSVLLLGGVGEDEEYAQQQPLPAASLFREPSAQKENKHLLKSLASTGNISNIVLVKLDLYKLDL